MLYSIPFAILSSALLAAASPILSARIVPTLSCKAIDLSETPNLFVRSQTVDTQAVKLDVDWNSNLTWQGQPDAAQVVDTGVFGFEECKGRAIKATSDSLIFGHVTWTVLDVQGKKMKLCLSAPYPYTGVTPYLDKCSKSDDSSQFWQYWALDTSDSAHPVLSFVGPAGSVTTYKKGYLSPKTFDADAPLTLASVNSTESYFAYGIDE